MTIRIITMATRTKPTDNNVLYGSGINKFYVDKAVLKNSGCKTAPESLYRIITDELPAGWEMPLDEVVEFTL